ncbi:MAG: PLP-dependent lyase/thiolase [Gammaproteobacteria bacterium]
MIVNTPIQMLVDNLLVKREDLQRSGSFKIRGVLNVLLEGPEAIRDVVVASTGNTALAACDLSTEFNLKVKACIPANVGAAKRAALKRCDADIIEVSGGFARTAKVAQSLAREIGAQYISPGSDALFAVGNATVCAEILDSRPHIEQIVVPCGGGGLIVGIGSYARAHPAHPRVVGVQLAESPYLYQLLKRGSAQGVVETPTTIESLAGELEDDALAYSELARVCDDIVLVSEARARDAQELFFAKTRTWIDLGAAAAVAGAEELESIATCVVVTGRAR